MLGIVYIDALNDDFEKKYNILEGEKEIKAVVITEPENMEYKYRYTIRVESIKLNGNEIDIGNIKLYLDVKIKDTKYMPKFGDKILIKGEIKIPDSSRNYKGFNYREYLKTKKIFGTVESSSLAILEKECLNYIEKLVNNVQNSMKKNLKKILDEEESSLCTGILIGDRTNISEEIENDFKQSNLTHMLAVSGSHIVYIINGFTILLSKTNKKLSKIIIIIFLLFFIILTGFTSSVLRASFMGILILISSIIYRKSDTLNNIGISSLIILIINPYIILDVGFILSFAGTLGIVLLSPNISKLINKIFNMFIKKMLKINNKKNKIREKKVFNKLTNNKSIKDIIRYIIKYIFNSFSITLSANILIIPIMAFYFSTFSFTFLISNILAAPFMEMVTIFGFIIYFISIICIPIAEFLGLFLNFLLNILIKIAKFSSTIPGSSIFIRTPYLISCIFFYTILIYVYNRKKINELINKMINKKANKIMKIILNNKLKIKIQKIHHYILVNKKKLVLIILFVFILVNLLNNFVPKSLKIYFIDVGQGDSTLIQTQYGRNILIDGGGSEFGTYDIGENILLPYLLDRRINKLDYIVISHFDSDHVKGVFKVIEELEVSNIIISRQGEVSENFKEFQKIVSDKNVNIIIVKKGDYITIDRLSFIEILFPEDKLINENILNNNSIVMKFVSGDFDMLFTGDIEKIAEDRLIELYKNTNKLKADILKVAHHGSKTSSTEEFIELVKPEIGLIGVGKNNNFGHPNEEITERLENNNIQIYRTDECGEIIIVKKNKKKMKTIINCNY